MSLRHENKVADSPFAEMVWHTQSEGDNRYIASADSSWDVLILRQKSETKIFVAGPNTKATPVIYKEGMEKLGIRFKVGTFMPQLPLCSLVDSIIVLPNATNHSFWLGDVAWKFPDFENVEAFVERLERHHLVARDPLIEAIVDKQEPFIPKRSLQRRFLQSTGLSHKSIYQIERARNAVELLEQGTSISDTIYELGYTDQPHLTKMLKRFMGYTPLQIQKRA